MAAALCAAWEPRGEEAAALLARASREKVQSSACEVFGVDPAPLLLALEHLRKPLHRELKLRAASAGTPGFRWCDLWAQVPAAPGGTAIALPDAMSALEKIFDRACEGGAAFLLEFIAAGRLHLEGDRPHCHPPAGGGPAHVYLPERFVRVLPAELPTIAHELGHALHCDLTERLSHEKPYGMIFAETFSQLMEELAWHELGAEVSDARQRQTLKLGRIRQDVFDFLLTPALLELEEILVPAAKSAGLPLEAIEKAQDKVMRKWFPAAAPARAPFWIRAERFFNPELPFDGFVYMAGRALSMGMAARIERNGKLKRAELEDLARDTV